MPLNNWEESDPKRRWESSAAAIAASGLLQLSELSKDRARKVHYRDYAHTILDTLLSTEFFGLGVSAWEGILRHGGYHGRLGFGVDESVMQGEHFFCEALNKLLGADALG